MGDAIGTCGHNRDLNANATQKQTRIIKKHVLSHSVAAVGSTLFSMDIEIWAQHIYSRNKKNKKSAACLAYFR